MEPMIVTVRTAQGDRHLEIELDATYTASEIVDAVRKQLHMPEGHDCVLRLPRTGRQLAPGETLAQAGVEDRDELELMPVLVAGGRS